MSASIHVNLLGPLEVRLSGQAVQFEGTRQRALFTMLALRAPRAVTVDELVEAVWADAPPAGAMHALQKQVSRLRRRVGDDMPLRHGPAGYALEIDPGAIDSRRFEELLRQARSRLVEGDPKAACDALGEALALWRGPALADHRFDAFAQSEIARLEELRLEAIEERLGAELACGRAADLVGELQALVAEHPLRERLRGHLMVALYRSGRQAEALEAMREGRRRLVDELGIEPSPELRRLENMILAQDPELGAERPPSPPPPPMLPTPSSPMIGRAAELRDVAELLTRADARVITLTGPGGVGKTRLALEAARVVEDGFPGGVGRVSLDGLEHARVLAAEAAAALGVVATTAAEVGERLERASGGAPVLLVLDGFERFLEDAGEVAALLGASPSLKVLVTSRGALRLSGERAYPVEPLAPEGAADLFAARAAAARPGWTLGPGERELVEAICGRLDGLPLAIELAADRTRLLRLPALLERLERRMDVLTEGPRDRPARQRSLRSTLEWSWEALAEDERRLLARLSVFEGGIALAAAEAVGDFDGTHGAGFDAALESLLDKTSLLRTEPGAGDTRFTMLDTIREFAAERAAGYGERDALERAHSAFFLGYAERAAADARAHRRDALERLASERANLRLAHERLLRVGDADAALRIAVAFAEALPWDAHTQEVRGWLADGLAALGPEHGGRRAIALYWDGRLALSQARFAECETRLQAALEAARDAGEPRTEILALTALGRWATLVARPDATALTEAAVAAARMDGDGKLIADALLALAGACERDVAFTRARTLASEALDLYRAAGDPYGAASALAELGWYDMVHGDGAQAEAQFDEALELRRRHGDDRRLVEPLIDRAWLALVNGHGGEAQKRFLESLELARRVGDRFIEGEALAGLSSVAGREGRWEACALLAGASAGVYRGIGAPPWESVDLMHERERAAARDALGGPRFEARFTEGRALSPDVAVARAQEDLVPMLFAAPHGLGY